MEITDLRIDLVTSVGIHSGIGRYAEELLRVLSPGIPNLKLYLFSSLSSCELERAVSLSVRQTNNKFRAILSNRKNLKEIKKQELFRGGGLHLLGSDYSLSSTSDNFVMTIHEMYYILFDVFRAHSVPEMIKEEFFNLNVLKLKRIANLSRGIVVPSKYASSQVQRNIGVKPKVIHHVVDGSKFHKREKEKVREQLGLPVNKYIALNVSGGGSNKNLRVLERIVNSLSGDIIFIKINEPLNSKRSTNLGIVPESLYSLYFSAADFYVNTSVNEGFGIPLLESLKCGLPVISNKRATAEEILSYAGSYVRDPFDHVEYVDEIDLLKDKKYNLEFSERSVSRGLDFSDETFFREYLKFYNESFRL
jgi:glycosyltransferase involved in cell wall biosynthesis